MIKRWLAPAVFTLLLAGGMARPAPAGSSSGRLRIETDFSFTPNLVHWVDNLAGSSLGKTIPEYRRYWEERFGPPDAEDRKALDAFARIRRIPMPVTGRSVANSSGCLPVETEAMSWHQIFLVEAMQAGSSEDLRRALASHLGEPDLAQVMASLERFRPRFERVWKDLGHVRQFEGRFRRFLEKGELLRYLDTLAGFFGVDARSAPPLKISFMALPSNGSTHAEADGDHLLIEIRPLDSPLDQVQVVAHEASHFLMKRMTPEQIDRLARQAFSEGEAGALVWRYMWEGLPTALGQGLAEARLSPHLFSTSTRWYHIASIDRFARMIYPAVADAVGGSKKIQDGVMAAITRIVRGSSLYREARATEFLMTAFYSSGEGMAGPMESLRLRLGPRGEGASAVFGLGDPDGSDLLRRYACLGGVALVAPGELERASLMDGTPLLTQETVRQAQERAARGMGMIAAGRRSGGGMIYFLVSPTPELASPVIEAFARLRGVPDRPILITRDLPVWEAPSADAPR